MELIYERWALYFVFLEVLVGYTEGLIPYFCKQPSQCQVVLKGGTFLFKKSFDWMMCVVQDVTNVFALFFQKNMLIC